MKIYFCGSITAGRGDQPIYAALIEHLSHCGEVLTRHVGDPRLTESGETGLSDAVIYDRDTTWLRSADVVVAEVTVPSHGVGVEIAKAEEWGKPILCLFRPSSGRKLSPMIGGSKKLEVREYRTFEQAYGFIDTFLGELGETAPQKAAQRPPSTRKERSRIRRWLRLPAASTRSTR